MTDEKKDDEQVGDDKVGVKRKDEKRVGEVEEIRLLGREVQRLKLLSPRPGDLPFWDICACLRALLANTVLHVSIIHP